MPATIRDVARKASVGVGTVSRVLNESPSVREETRARVLAAIEDLDFTPNPIARQLSTGQTLTIGVILPYLTMPSYIERLRGVQSKLADSKYDLVLFAIENPTQRDAYFENLSLKSRVDGVLLISLPPNDEQASRLTKSNIPSVLIDGYHPNFCCVYPDDVQGGRIATQHLIELGHRKIAYLSDHLDTPFHPSMRLRYQGYRETLEAENIPLNPEFQIEGDRGRLNARSMARVLLSLDDPPTAIFAASDTQAIGAIEAAAELGFHVPRDLSVVGYDDIRDAAYLELTTIDQQLVASGIEGAKMLLDLLDDSKQGVQSKQTISVDLVVRGSTRPPKA
jgi:DNA-binding LacI/PurR family transcriptional regulator